MIRAQPTEDGCAHSSGRARGEGESRPVGTSSPMACFGSAEFGGYRPPKSPRNGFPFGNSMRITFLARGAEEPGMAIACFWYGKELLGSNGEGE